MSKRHAKRFEAGQGSRSTAFTPKDGKGKRYLLDTIPAALWRDFKAKCKAKPVSLRARILTLIQEDVSRPE